MSTTFLKKYKVIQKIGEGSFSEVLKCQDRVTGFVYAGKRLKSTYQSLNEILDSPEVIAMRKISRHPNILYMIECHYDSLPGKVTLMFELMDMSLYDLIRSRKGRVIQEVKAKFFLYQLLKGLDHLHKYGIFHRDIKPENILVKGNTMKLADFGSVRGIYSKPPYTEYISTRWYRSPECLLTTGFYGPKMDIWALGCVYFELLTLKPLFPGSNEIDQIIKIHGVLGTPHARIIAKFRRHKSKSCEFFFPNKPGIGISALVPHVSDAGKELMKMMLVYDPENRSNGKRLLENRYFNDLRACESPRQMIPFPYPSATPEGSHWRNPMLLSYITSEKRRKCKPLSTRRPKFFEEGNSKTPRIVASSPNARPNVSSKSNVSKIAVSERGDSSASITHDARRQRNILWRRNVYSTRTERPSGSPSSTFSSKLPVIKSKSTKFEGNGESRIAVRKIPPRSNQSGVSSHYNLRGSTLIASGEQKSSKRIRSVTLLPEIVQKPEVKRRLSSLTVPKSQGKTEGEKKNEKNTRLTTIVEAKVPLVHIDSPNIKSPAKKIPKHEIPSDTHDINRRGIMNKRVKGIHPTQ
ncbi:MAPK/MAK/MRK overlapping kinase-like [Fopius arisanus]|uniref:MAPK/MAK/MRK overlapping kinase-like n=1 Tax=Fopius arisanus TaxID=64838 RepID=A0A9R1TWE4_9HYME|nr:PREDICTED: MAPK/MAK/MRK overlapping kinase-like [Fopius arisanus]